MPARIKLLFFVEKSFSMKCVFLFVENSFVFVKVCVFFSIKTKVSCHAAASGGSVRPKIWSRSEDGQKSQHFESCQNGRNYSGKS